MNEVAADRALITDANSGHRRECLRERRAIGAHERRSFDLGVRDHRPDLQTAVLATPNASERLDATQRDNAPRLHQSQLEHQDERCATGKKVDVRARSAKERERIVERLRLDVVEVVHRASLSPAAARMASTIWE